MDDSKITQLIEMDSIVLDKNIRSEEVDDLDELAASIKAKGLLQPIIVKKTDDEKYELIAGFRRYHACKKLGWKKIAALIRHDADEDKKILQAVENLQRKNLKPWEIYLFFDGLKKEGFNKTQIAKRINKSPQWVHRYFVYGNVANSLKEIGIEFEDIEMVPELTLGHLYRLSNQQRSEVFKKIYDKTRFECPVLPSKTAKKIVDDICPPKQMKGMLDDVKNLPEKDRIHFWINRSTRDQIILSFSTIKRCDEVVEELENMGGEVI